MAIRIVNNKGVADTQAELLASTQANNINFYCVDTENTFSSINGIYTTGITIGVEDDITVISNVTNYIIDTGNAGKDITISFPFSLPEGVIFLFKRAESSFIAEYKIIFDFQGLTCDFDVNNDNELIKDSYDGISLIKWNTNWNIK